MDKFYLPAGEEPITFYSKSVNKMARKLSNFDLTSGPIEILFEDGYRAVYSSGEHAFQSAKFRIIGGHDFQSTTRQSELFAYSVLFEIGSEWTCAEAKKKGKQLRLTSDELKLWNREASEKIQLQICCQKLLQDRELRSYIKSTDKKYLIHHEAFGYSLYGGIFLKPDDSGRRFLKGENRLGKIWMTLRDCDNIVSCITNNNKLQITNRLVWICNDL